MARPGDDGNGIKSVDTALRIATLVRERDGATLSEVADAFDVSKSTAHRHLTTLQRHGLVTKEGEQYRIGLGFLDFGIHARNRRSIYGPVEEKTTELAERTGERAQFLVPENGRGSLLFNHVGENGIMAEIRQGKRVHLHSNAAGKCILAHLPDGRVEVIVDDHGLPARTENTITERAELLDHLETVREQRYATNLGERVENLKSVGVPVLVDGDVIGGLSVTGPTRRMRAKHDETELADLLKEVAEDLALRITYDADST